MLKIRSDSNVPSLFNSRAFLHHYHGIQVAVSSPESYYHSIFYHAVATWTIIHINLTRLIFQIINKFFSLNLCKTANLILTHGYSDYSKRWVFKIDGRANAVTRQVKLLPAVPASNKDPSSSPRCPTTDPALCYGLEKAGEDGLRAWAPAPKWENRKKLLVTGFGSAQL